MYLKFAQNLKISTKCLEILVKQLAILEKFYEIVSSNIPVKISLNVNYIQNKILQKMFTSKKCS